jgi:gas vesicle structural protein
MAVERGSGTSSLIDILDRVLDKGIVIDAWVRVSLVGIDLLRGQARIVVASIDTYLKDSETAGQIEPAARPAELPAMASVEAIAAQAESRVPARRRKG